MQEILFFAILLVLLAVAISLCGILQILSKEHKEKVVYYRLMNYQLCKDCSETYPEFDFNDFKEV